jgi:hypothetical protein
LALASALPSRVSLESLYLNQHDVGRPCNDTCLLMLKQGIPIPYFDEFTALCQGKNSLLFIDFV